jgi:hypothetical protein
VIPMLALRAPDVLALWEQGRARHPIDRALLLFAAACPELPADRLADLPLGERNAALLRLRRRTFGPEVRAYIDCPACRERMELALQVDMFLPPKTGAPSGGELETDGFRFRLPTSRDLSALLGHADAESAAAQLLERCCVGRPDGATTSSLHGLLEKIEAGLEVLDPGADIELSLVCESCAHRWAAPFDIAAVLWDEVDARARALLAAVHTLARAYGWSEREVLALGEQRREAYLEMVTA